MIHSGSAWNRQRCRHRLTEHPVVSILTMEVLHFKSELYNQRGLMSLINTVTFRVGLHTLDSHYVWIQMFSCTCLLRSLFSC